MSFNAFLDVLLWKGQILRRWLKCEQDVKPFLKHQWRWRSTSGLFSASCGGSGAKGGLELLEGSLPLFFLHFLPLAFLFLLSNLGLELAAHRQSLHLLTYRSTTQITLKSHVALHGCLLEITLWGSFCFLKIFALEFDGITQYKLSSYLSFKEVFGPHHSLSGDIDLRQSG